MRRTTIALLGATSLALAVPAMAGAAEPARDLFIDFQAAGPMRDLLGKTLGVARSFLFFSAFLAYALEALGRSPTEPRDYGAVTWRLVIVLFLLWHYQAIFGSVIGLLDGIERRLMPASTWSALKQAVQEGQQVLSDLATDGEPAGGSGPPSRLTSWVYEVVISVVLLLGEGLVFLIRWLSRILTATLFVLGPLALVAGIPRVSSTGSRWFLRFVTIASWPIFASVLLSVMVALRGQGALHRSYLEALVAALVLVVTALSTPSLASQVVGGALQNFAGAGYLAARQTQREAVAPATRGVVALAGGAKGLVLSALQSVGALTGRSSGAPGGSHQGGGGRGGSAGGVSANPPAPPPGQRPRGRGRRTP